MLALCPFCATNTHSDQDKATYPVCVRKFIKPGAAWKIISAGLKKRSTIHVYANPREGVLIGADWPKGNVKQELKNAEYIEICDKDGKARQMKHGIAMLLKDDKRILFIETNENELKAFESVHRI